MKTFRRNTIEEVVTEILSLQTPLVKEVDHGIGDYEYWGAKGTDVQLDGEVEELEDIKIELHFQLQGTKPNLLDENFQEWFEEINDQVSEAIEEIETQARKKVAGIADEYGVKDYSDIIKLSCVTLIETTACSTGIYRLAFLLTWCDAREA